MASQQGRSRVGTSTVEDAPAGRPLLERDRELELIDAAIALARAGQGRSVVVSGPAGIGKSELLRAATERAPAAGVTALVARASEFEQGFAFGVVRQLLEPLVTSAGDDRRAELYAGSAALAQQILEGTALDDGALAPDPGYGVLHGLYWLVANLADQGPLLLAIDDVQWSDASSLRWLSFIARRIDSLPVVLVVTERSDEPEAGAVALDSGLAEAGDLVRPAPLSRAGTADLVRAQLSPEADARFCEACHDATRGNPLYLRELLGSLRARGVAPSAAAAGQVVEVGPQSVARLVLGRLEQLGPQAQALAEACALLGDGGELALAGALAGLDEPAQGDAAQRLRQGELLTGGDTIAWLHPIARAAVANAMAPHERARLSAVAARRLAEDGKHEEAASHLLAVAPAGDEQVVEILRLAADRARARGAVDVRATLLARALAEPPPDALRPALLHALGAAEMDLHRPTAADRLEEALRATPAGPARARVARDLAWALFNLHRMDEGYSVLEQGAAELDPARDPELLDDIQVRLIEYARFLPHRTPPAGTKHARTERMRLAYEAIDQALGCGPGDLVRSLAERALDGGRLVAEASAGSAAPYFAIYALALAGEPASAGAQLEQAIDLARRRGAIATFAGACSLRARLALARGDLREAEADVRTVLEHGDEGLGRDFVLGALLSILIEKGRLEEAQRELEASNLRFDVPELQVFDYALHERGRLRLAHGQVEDGLADVLACGARQEAAGSRNPADMPWRSTAALALAGQGDLARARELSDEEVELARTFGVPGPLGASLVTRALLADPSARPALVADAVAVLEQGDRPLELARGLIELGRLLRESGQASEARTPLRRALTLAEERGASRLAERAVAELVAAGGKPRTRPRRGVDALTPSERRVADLAAQELTNRQIAQALFVTEKTVETHLLSAFRKLGVHSRVQLAPQLRDEPAA